MLPQGTRGPCGRGPAGLGRPWLDSQHLPSPPQIEHCHSECVTDTQICGARFCDPEGSSFAVTGYDLSEIIRYAQV